MNPNETQRSATVIDYVKSQWESVPPSMRTYYVMEPKVDEVKIATSSQPFNVERRNSLRLAACRSERKLNEIKAKYDQMKIENENLRKKASKKKEYYEQIKIENEEHKKCHLEMSKKMEHLESKNRQLNTKLQQANTDNNKKLKAHDTDAAKLDKLVKENSSLKESVVNIKNKFKIKQQNYIEAIEQANKGRKCDNKIQIENEDLKKSHRMMSTKLEDLTAENDQLNKNYIETKNQLEQISCENSKLLEAHKIDIANLETMTEENSTLKASVDQLKHQFGITEEKYIAGIEKANYDLQQMKQLENDLRTQLQTMSVKQELVTTSCQTDEWRVDTKKASSTDFVLRGTKKVITGSKSKAVVSEKSAGIRQQPSVKKPAWKF